MLLRNRDRELDLLRTSLAGVAGGGGRCVVVRGAPGSGRTAVLDRVPDLAPGEVRVLRLTGARTEAGLPFASVHQLLHPLRDRIDRLPAPQAEALGTVFGLAHAAPDPYLIGLATLTLLADAAADRPLLVLADDADRLDRRSADILAFTARRLDRDPIALVATTSVHRGGWADVAATEVVLAPLSRAALGQVVTDRFPDIAATALAGVVTEADGSPGIALELAGALDRRQRRGTAPLPAILPVRGPVADALARTLDPLPARSRTLLLLAAAGAADLGTLLAAGRELEVASHAVEPLLSAGPLAVAGDEVSFVPRAARSVVYHAAPAHHRSLAHDALAKVAVPGGGACLRHRALAATGVDDRLADALAAHADERALAGEHRTAAQAHYRASALAGGGRRRAAHLAAAAESAWRAGEPWAMAAARRAVRDPDPHTRARVAHLRGLAALATGPPADVGRRLLTEARALLATGPPDGLAGRMLRTAAHAAWLDDDTATLAGIAGLAPVEPWPAATDGSVLADVPAHLAAVEDGRGDRTEPAVRSALAEAERRGQHTVATVLRALLAWIAAVRGRTAECDRLAPPVVELARERGPRWAGAVGLWSLGLAALGAGRSDDAVRHLLAVAGPSARHGAVAEASAPDLVEALVRVGRTAEAVANVPDGDGPGGAVAVLRCRAAIADGAGPSVFHAVLDHPATSPFAAARTRLLYGEWLRRERKVGEARATLEAALAWFEPAGAGSWAHRCRTALAATAGPRGAAAVPGANGPLALTPRQLQIVRSAAAGRSNQEIAAELFISPRTVSDHLYKLFPKLGISSRRQLRELHAELSADHRF